MEVRRRGVARQVERHLCFGRREGDSGQVAAGQVRQLDRRARAGIEDGDLSRGVGVDPADAVGPLVGPPHEQDVPVRLDERGVLPGGRIPCPRLPELAVGVRAVGERGRSGQERHWAVARVPLVRGDVAGLGVRVLEVHDEHVGIGVVPGPGRGEPAPVAAHRSRLVAARVLEHEAAFEGGRVVFVQIERLWIPLVARHEEAGPVVGEAAESGLQVLARRGVGHRSVRVPDEEVVQLVPALVGREQDPVVFRKERHRHL